MVSAVNSELEEHPELCRNILSVKKLKDTSDFLNRVDILFLCFAFGYCDLSAGVVGEHIHLDRIAEYIGNEAQMMNDGLSRKRSARAFACAVDMVVDKLLNVPARNLVEPQMPDCGVHSCCKLFHSLKRGIAQIDFCVFLKPLLGKGFKLDCCYDLSFFAFFLEHYALPIKLFLYLSCRHIRFRLPSLCLYHLFAVYIISARYLDTVAVASFCDCCHILKLLLVNLRL